VLGECSKTLVDEIKFEGRITGVEIDPIIQLANDYFKLNEIQQLEIVIDDAFEFVLDKREILIVIDVFQDTKMPNFYENYFINRICLLLKSKGFVLFNTMLLNEEHNLRNKKYISDFCTTNYTIKTIPELKFNTMN
jgi:spermidine synthase